MKKFRNKICLGLISLAICSQAQAAPSRRPVKVSLNNELCEYLNISGAQIKVCVSGAPKSSQIPREELGLIQLKAKSLLKKQALKNNFKNNQVLPENEIDEVADPDSDVTVTTSTQERDPSAPDVSSYDPSAPDVSSYDPSSPDISSPSYSSTPAIPTSPTFVNITSPNIYPLKVF